MHMYGFAEPFPDNVNDVVCHRILVDNGMIYDGWLIYNTCDEKLMFKMVCN